MKIPASVLGLLRGLFMVVFPVVLTYLGDATNLQAVFSPTVSTIISLAVLGFEHAWEAKTGNALLGVVHTA